MSQYIFHGYYNQISRIVEEKTPNADFTFLYGDVCYTFHIHMSAGLQGNWG